MNMVVAFDTLKYANEMKKSGLSAEQAETQTAALASVMNELLQGGLATKQDVTEVRQELTEVRQELKQDIAEVRQELTEVKQELKQDIAEVRQELREVRQELKQVEIRLDTKIDSVEWKLTVRLGGIVSAGVSILAALMIILHLT